PLGESISIELAYEALGHIIRSTLADFGLDCYWGCVPQSICDGRFNLTNQKRKIAGFAQHRKNDAILVHAFVFLSVNLDEATGVTNEYYSALGQSRTFEPLQCVTLQELVSFADVEAVDVVKEQFVNKARVLIPLGSKAKFYHRKNRHGSALFS